MRIKRKTRSVEEIPLASTADIAFLLIVFFLAASALLEMRGVSLPIPVKDAPPMEILKKNIYRIDVPATGGYLVKNKTRQLEQIGKEVITAYTANAGLVVLVKVSPDAPSEAIPAVIQTLQNANIPRISVSMDGSIK